MTSPIPIPGRSVRSRPNDQSHRRFSLPSGSPSPTTDALVGLGINAVTDFQLPTTGRPTSTWHGSDRYPSNFSRWPTPSPDKTQCGSPNKSDCESPNKGRRGSPKPTEDERQAQTEALVARVLQFNDAVATLKAENTKLESRIQALQRSREDALALVGALTGYPLSSVLSQLGYLVHQYKPGDEEYRPPLDLWWDISCESPGVAKHPRPATLEAACLALSWAYETRQCTATVIQMVGEVSRHLARATQVNTSLVDHVLLQVCDVPSLQKSRDTRDGWDHMLVLALDVALRLAIHFGSGSALKQAVRWQNAYLKPPYISLATALTGTAEVSAHRVMRLLKRDGYVAGPNFGMVTCDKLVVSVDVGEKRIQIQQRADVVILDRTRAKMWVGGRLGRCLLRRFKQRKFLVAWRGPDDGEGYKKIGMTKKARMWWEAPLKSIGACLPEAMGGHGVLGCRWSSGLEEREPPLDGNRAPEGLRD